MLVGVLTGESPVRKTCPVAPVVISGGGEGDQSVESPDVKASVG
jgi:DhnA family fructose-bisphosphate aldolase class Ia